jgi:hypothetical protein
MRRENRPATARQRGMLVHLARVAGIEVPQVRWRAEASKAITRLERIAREPTLGPM